MIDAFWKAVSERLAADVQGWGLSNRYECREWARSHEGLVADGVQNAGFRWGDERYDGTRRRADGLVFHPGFPGSTLRYELKTVYIPHYTSARHPHNPDFERLLRLEHPNGALGDVKRLREAKDEGRVFLLLGVSWCDQGDHEKLSEYERHRGGLLGAFALLAGLPAPTMTQEIRTADVFAYPWSARLQAWSL